MSKIGEPTTLLIRPGLPRRPPPTAAVRGYEPCMRACANEQRRPGRNEEFASPEFRSNTVFEEFASPEFGSNTVFEGLALSEIVQFGDTPDLAPHAG
jgi:hypothetical protein